jgi:hypothetical protein
MTPAGPIYRVGWRPDPWAPPDWVYATRHGIFGGRYDDPEGQYRVLYANSSRHGCFIETLARFRLSLAFLSELQAIDGDDDFVPLTEVDRGWFTQRLCGQAQTDARFADVFATAWIAVLRVHFARLATALGIADLDASTLQLTEVEAGGRYRLTQAVSRYVFEQSDGPYAGVRYISKYGADLINWAIFEPFSIRPGPSSEIDPDGDPDVQRALMHHHLTVSPSAHGAPPNGGSSASAVDD